MLSEIRDAEDRDHATKAIHAGARHDATKYPKDVAKIVDHTETLLAFFDFPGRALDPPEDDRSSHLRHRGASDEGHQGPPAAEPLAWPWSSS